MHIPVLVDEVISTVSTFVDGCEGFKFFDMTFGFGGHSLAVLKHFPLCKVVATEVDPEVFDLAKQQDSLREYFSLERLTLFNRSYADFDFTKESSFFKKVVLFDFGINSFQQDNRMSFNSEEAFNLLFSSQKNPTLLNSKVAIERALIEFSDFSVKDARTLSEIIFVNQGLPQVGVKELIVERFKFLGYSNLQRFLSRAWQALRIMVNNELLSEEIGLKKALLLQNALVLAITFHSSEDRLVKNTFRNWQRENENCEILTKKPISASLKEISVNNRSRSAKLRVVKLNTPK